MTCFDILCLWIDCAKIGVLCWPRVEGTGSEFSWCIRHILLVHTQQGLQQTWQFFTNKQIFNAHMSTFGFKHAVGFWNFCTHLFTSVIILPEVGEHWGRWLRLPFYRGRAGEDGPVRNIWTTFVGSFDNRLLMKITNAHFPSALGREDVPMWNIWSHFVKIITKELLTSTQPKRVHFYRSRTLGHILFFKALMIPNSSSKLTFISTVRCSIPHPTRRSIHPIRPLIAPQCYIHLRWRFLINICLRQEFGSN